jgi:hypothetical protein
MAKSSKKDLDETTRIMGRLAAMPHKPHITVSKSLGESSKKKGDGPPAKKNRRPQGA